MKEQDAAHSFDKEILEKHITYRQLLTFGNYSCVGIPYTDALKAIQSITAELTRLRSELQQKDEKFSELNDFLEWFYIEQFGYNDIGAKKSIVQDLIRYRREKAKAK